MPCNGQSDMWAVDMLFNSLGIDKVTIDIGNIFGSLMQNISDNQINISETTRINAPARLRMTTLFGVAQSLDGIVVNTCNYSESCQGYDTLFGDDCGSYAPIQDLTKTEVRSLSEYGLVCQRNLLIKLQSMDFNLLVMKKDLGLLIVILMLLLED